MWSVERNPSTVTTTSSSSSYPPAQDADGDGARVIVRDFAYSRMAAARNNIRDVNATTFAEYV